MRARQQAVPLPPGEELHPTAMIERPGRVLRWIFARFFREITFPDEAAERIRALAQRGRIVYVCRTLSYVDYLYFTFAFLAHGLPLSRFANGVKTLLLQPLGRILGNALRLWQTRKRPDTDDLRDVVKSGGAALLFLKRPQTLFGWEPAGFRGEYVEALIRLQRDDPRPIFFVPIVLLWGSPAVRAAKQRPGLVDTVFGGREAPGRLRALWMFFRHYQDSQVRVAEPIELRQFLDEETGVDEAHLARRLRWQLHGRLESEVRVVLGPVRKGSRRIRDEVLKGRKLNAEAQVISREQGIPWPVVQKRARSALAEIAADPSPWAFDVLKPILAWVSRRIFDGFEIDEAGLERVRQAAKQGPLILVPSHKSHMDYLVLSYVFSENDLVPPHIAAGANLSFFPLGFMFRRAGAFFLRRSFKGDRLYGSVFRAYVRKLLREGNSIEFFIEGGRSRSGKLLPPKMGLLNMLVEAALDDDGRNARRAQVVPISIGYEKVIEEKSYARELAGGKKEKEDVRGLLKATRVLKGQYGRLNIQFDEPFPLGATLRELGALVAWDEDENVVVPADEGPRRRAAQRLAQRIVYGINRATAVTPTALLAAALLGSGRRGTTRKELLEQARFLMTRVLALGGRLSATVAQPDSGALNLDALDRALALLQRDGHLEIRGGSGTLPPGERSGATRGAYGEAVPSRMPAVVNGRALDEIYTIPDEHRPRVAFYRNNAVHLFVADALVALALLSATSGGSKAERVIGRSLLRERTLRASRLLKLEFSYRVGESFEAIFDGTVAGMIQSGLLAETVHEGAGTLSAVRVADLRLLAGQVIDFVEAYRVAALALDAMSAPLAKKELLRRVHELGERMFLTGDLRRREACIDANYANAIAYFIERGWVVEQGDKLQRAPAFDARRVAGEIADLLPRE
jgi:glycerol-3-phosphate O-acyltransferase